MDEFGEEEKMPPTPRLIWNVSIAVLLLLIVAGCWLISAALGRFNDNAIFAPIRLMEQFWQVTALVLFVVVALCHLGIRRRKKLWYLLPVGLVLAGAMWLTASIMVVDLIQDAKKEAKSAAVQTSAGADAEVDTTADVATDTLDGSEVDTGVETSSPEQ